MGIAVSNTRRALRNWNATNRAIKYLDKTAAKRQTTPSRLNIEESYKELDKSLYEKNIALEQRVMGFDIKSEGVKKSILPEEFDYVPKSTRKLPKVIYSLILSSVFIQRIEIGNPIPPPYVELGFAIPECIPKGKITLKQAINMIKSYQLKDKSVEQLAVDYDLDVQMVRSFMLISNL